MKFRNLYLFLAILLLMKVDIPAASNLLMPGDEDYLPIAEVMPEPADGLANLMKKIQYPEFAKKTGQEGRVIAMAYINENGDVDDVKIIKGVGGGCSEEVERVLKSSKFKPGMKGGQPVKVKLTMSFVFKLN
ncbi:energy transducer TonB [Melioribacter sp. Ez-97]|jgi:protein TonB|uniref:energy transducer TonB n=1 Tax=Melioribacter sp. Ez-97 TaxID=3423434 RepID=UPI003ED96F6B